VLAKKPPMPMAGVDPAPSWVSHRVFRGNPALPEQGRWQISDLDLIGAPQ